MQLRAKLGHAPALFRRGQRHHRIGRQRPQPRPGGVGLVAQSGGNIVGEAHHPAIGRLRLEAEAMGNGRGNQDGGRRGEGNGRGLEGHFAPAPGHEQYLRQIAVPVRADHPIMDRGARGDRFDVDKVECLIIR